MMKSFWKSVGFVMAVFVVIVLFTQFAFAADGTSAPVAGVLSSVLEVVTYGIVTLLTLVVAIVAKKVSTKFNVEIPQSWMASAQVWLDKGIAFAEEKAKQALKNNETINSSAKLNAAAEFVLDMAEDKKLVQLGKEKLKALIEARLHEKRMSDTLHAYAAGVLDSAPVETKMLMARGDQLIMMMEDGSEHDITDLIASAGYIKPESTIAAAAGTSSGASAAGVIDNAKEALT